jgi:hypothetical protein
MIERTNSRARACSFAPHRARACFVAGAVLLAPASAAPAAAPAAPAESVSVATDAGIARAPGHVRISSTLLVLDRTAVRRAGLSYVVLGPERVRLVPLDGGRGAARGVRVEVGALGVRAFLDAVRTNRWVRTETTQHVLALSGASAHVSSLDTRLGAYGTHTRGPVLNVLPTILDDGRIHLHVSTRLEDVDVDRYWGYAVDGSPVAVATELIVRAGEDVIIASGGGVEASRETGLLYIASTDRERDVLVVVRATVE